MIQSEIISLFKESGALLEGHFQLTSGLHSPAYFQCAKVLQHPKNAELLCGMIANHFRIASATVVIAPALGGIVVGQEVGRQLNLRTMFSERKDGSMQLRRGFRIEPGEQVLVCEDVITTGGSVNEVIAIVKEMGAAVVGVGAIVDRSGGKALLPNLYTTVAMEVVTYDPSSCPLCKKNIPIDKPGSRSNVR